MAYFANGARVVVKEHGSSAYGHKGTVEVSTPDGYLVVLDEGFSGTFREDQLRGVTRFPELEDTRLVGEKIAARQRRPKKRRPRRL